MQIPENIWPGTYDPGECPLLCSPPNLMIWKNLTDCLEALKDRSGGSGVLTVLEPLVLSHKKELPAKVSEWTAEIHSMELPENKTEYLLKLLEYAILQRFPNLTLKEIQKMIKLTPIGETVAGKPAEFT